MTVGRKATIKGKNKVVSNLNEPKRGSKVLQPISNTMAQPGLNGILKEVNSLDVLECSSAFSNLRKDAGQQQSMMVKETGENIGHEPKKSSYVDNLSIRTDVAIKDLIQGLSKFVVGDMVMVKGDTALVKMNDEMLTNAKKA
ncbi:hypothetical protein PVK06_009206 [Gossypium arboreum]|uniref:Uncharacterized protein n=1 Tax=Gossypium arboreum TaxID=29729 RepID=A0ABR0QLU4_GOSAR|nr:hypothetical protein PVK06_009206 [Gossypium arboreum]